MKTIVIRADFFEKMELELYDFWKSILDVYASDNITIICNVIDVEIIEFPPLNKFKFFRDYCQQYKIFYDVIASLRNLHRETDEEDILDEIERIETENYALEKKYRNSMWTMWRNIPDMIHKSYIFMFDTIIDCEEMQKVFGTFLWNEIKPHQKDLRRAIDEKDIEELIAYLNMVYATTVGNIEIILEEFEK